MTARLPDSVADVRVPSAITGTGVLLGSLLVGELVVFGVRGGSLPERSWIGAITSPPFLFSLLYAGYWLDGSDLPPRRYERIATWWAGTLVGVTVVVLGLVLATQSTTARVLAREGLAVGETESVALAPLAEQSWRAVATRDGQLEVAASAVVAADPDRLRHVFENLFRNAIDHAGGDVTVRVGRLQGGFYVEDDGPGIPEHERTEAFDPGWTTADGGTGFGLAIVRRVIEAHGWEIRIAESESGGARFEITGVEFVES